MPANQKELFESHYLDWVEDYVRDKVKKEIKLCDQQLRTLILFDIQKRLKSWDKDLKAFGLKEPSLAEISEVISNETENIPVLIKEEIEYDITELRKIADN